MLTGAHNDVRSGKEEERATTTQKIKFWKRSHGSPVTIFIFDRAPHTRSRAWGKCANLARLRKDGG